MSSINGLNINNILNQTNIQKYNNQTTSIKKKLDNAYNSSNDKELMNACKEFESIFMHMLLKQMRSTIPEGGLTEKSTAREIFEDMYDQELAKKATERGEGIGIAKMLYNQLKRG